MGDAGMRSIGVVSVSRSDYGIYLPLLKTIKEDPELKLTLFVTGMHLSPEFGLTVEEIKKDHFEISAQIEMLLSSDTPVGISKSMGLGLIGFAQTFERLKPDILIVLGDRFEMYTAALASIPFNIPIGHIHGGEITEGAFDDALRHSITKLSHLHFVSTKIYAERVIQMGEEPWRVTVVGAPGLDNLKHINIMDKVKIEAKYGIKLEPQTLLVTFHPTTLEHTQTEWQVSELLSALEAVNLPVVFTMPNADTAGRKVARMIESFVSKHTSSYLVNNMGTKGYFSMMAVATAMVGNSSSGIIEAGSFGLPVVNIGNRQRGRVKGSNVIDVDYNKESVIKGIKEVLNPQLREKLKKFKNPYDGGNSSKKIIEILKRTPLDEKLLIKRFYDINISTDKV
jgi:UDP-hydrolysing UDP-N-acetyl-D-glucosamine 2-epimerase